MGEVAIGASALTKTFGSFRAVHDVSLQVRHGEVYGLLGANGAGKTTTIKMITGDDTAIARETARQLGLGTNIVPAAEAFPKDMDPDHVPPQIVETILRADGFARVPRPLH